MLNLENRIFALVIFRESDTDVDDRDGVGGQFAQIAVFDDVSSDPGDLSELGDLTAVLEGEGNVCLVAQQYRKSTFGWLYAAFAEEGAADTVGKHFDAVGREVEVVVGSGGKHEVLFGVREGEVDEHIPVLVGADTSDKSGTGGAEAVGLRVIELCDGKWFIQQLARGQVPRNGVGRTDG